MYAWSAAHRLLHTACWRAHRRRLAAAGGLV